jgi:hypothetical protein
MGLIVALWICCLLIILALRFMKGMAYYDEMEDMIRQKSSKNHRGTEI